MAAFCNRCGANTRDGVCVDYCDALDCHCGRSDRTEPHEFGPGCDAWDDLVDAQSEDEGSTAVLTADLATARAELDAARAQVAAVEATDFADELEELASFMWVETQHKPTQMAVVRLRARLRAAIDQPGQAVARIKADALREAAAGLTKAGDDGYLFLNGSRERVPWGAVAAWFRARADDIEREAGL